MVEISIPSMIMRPLAGSTFKDIRGWWYQQSGSSQIAICSWLKLTCHYLKQELNDVCLYDMNCKPVRPSSPTRSPAFRVKEIFCSTAGSSGAYLMTRSSTTIIESLFELDGQYAGALLDSMIAGGSCGRSRLKECDFHGQRPNSSDILFNNSFNGAVILSDSNCKEI